MKCTTPHCDEDAFYETKGGALCENHLLIALKFLGPDKQMVVKALPGHEDTITPLQVSALGQTWWSEYDDLIQLFSDEIVARGDDSDYQGDSWMILRRGDEHASVYGYLSFSWGSCSGCDALQACSDDPKQIAELATELAASVQWQLGKQAMKDWVERHDWAGDHSAYTTGGGFQKFAKSVKEAGFGEIKVAVAE